MCMCPGGGGGGDKEHTFKDSEQDYYIPSFKAKLYMHTLYLRIL